MSINFYTPQQNNEMHSIFPPTLEKIVSPTLSPPLSQSFSPIITPPPSPGLSFEDFEVQTVANTSSHLHVTPATITSAIKIGNGRSHAQRKVNQTALDTIKHIGDDGLSNSELVSNVRKSVSKSLGVPIVQQSFDTINANISSQLAVTNKSSPDYVYLHNENLILKKRLSRLEELVSKFKTNEQLLDCQVGEGFKKIIVIFFQVGFVSFAQISETMIAYDLMVKSKIISKLNHWECNIKEKIKHLYYKGYHPTINNFPNGAEREQRWLQLAQQIGKSYKSFQHHIGSGFITFVKLVVENSLLNVHTHTHIQKQIVIDQ